MPDLETIAWATLPPDGDHRPVWGRTHLIEAEYGGRTLCGRDVPDDAFDLNRGDRPGGPDKCLVCARVLASRKSPESS